MRLSHKYKVFEDVNNAHFPYSENTFYRYEFNNVLIAA